ncbi:hypothetical protein SAMN03097699_2197 [Flavobacteriaceae bacterium MAR_2010_188]|nr:hypothetical protein SAMN03097699_2197 [Flavobacteriaceae bacterium MAR_2010_188]
MLNKFKLKSFLIVFIISFVFSCEEKKEDPAIAITADYQLQNDTYNAKLLKSRKENYLPLIALLKMDSTKMNFGSNEKNFLALRGDSIAPTFGAITKNDSIYEFEVYEDNLVKTLNDSIIKTMSLPLDSFGNSTPLRHKNIIWQIITRNDKPYLRVWDFANPEIENFKGFENYPLNTNMIFDGEFKYFQNKKSEDVDSQLGLKTITNFIGNVSFTYEGKSHSLDVGEGGFLMVNDFSSGNETYGGGRYMYLTLPEKDSIVTLDFNELYNPPCAFNKFTTCLYPPRQNEMPFKIEAGEKLKRN